MRSGILSNGKKDRVNTKWEIHNKKEQYKKYEYITVYKSFIQKWRLYMRKFLSLFVGSMCIIGFVNSMVLSYKYDSNWKTSLFCIFMGLVNCMAAISEIKDYLKY